MIFELASKIKHNNEKKTSFDTITSKEQWLEYDCKNVRFKLYIEMHKNILNFFKLILDKSICERRDINCERIISCKQAIKYFSQDNIA